MNYSEPNLEEMRRYHDKLDNFDLKKNYPSYRGLSKHDPTIFAKTYLNLHPFPYQDIVLNDKSQRVIICSSRQVGKTWTVIIRALWYSIYHPNSVVLVFSSSLDQAKRLIREMKKLINSGNEYFNREINKANASNQKSAWMFPEELDPKRPNNTTQISFKNGSTIHSLPATHSARGYPAHMVIVDEAAFVDEEVYETVIEPTVRFTGGSIFLISTPNGQKGFFYELFDPFDKKEHHEFARYWWNWRMCPNEEMQKMTELKRQNTRNPLKFEQEYEASFTSDARAFFNSRDVDDGVDNALVNQFDARIKVNAGIDYGMTEARTVVTLSGQDEEGKLIMVYQREFPSGYDISQLPDFMFGLGQRFNIDKYVVDDCAQGDAINKTFCNQGRNVVLFDFRKEKARHYCAFKNKLINHMIKYPDLPELLVQMKAMEIEENKKGGLSIHKPPRGKDDRVDSIMMSMSPWLLDEKRALKAYWI